MIFVDTNVFMYAVGKPHPLQSRAQQFFHESLRNRTALFTSAEVIHELMQVYLRMHRPHTLDSALELIEKAGVEVWPLEAADVDLARRLHEQHPTLRARDLCHLASCHRRGVREIMTFDEALAAAQGCFEARDVCDRLRREFGFELPDEPAPSRLGFMAGQIEQIEVPDDFDSMGGPEIEKMFGTTA